MIAAEAHRHHHGHPPSVRIRLKKHRDHGQGEEIYSVPDNPPALKLILKVNSNTQSEVAYSHHEQYHQQQQQSKIHQPNMLSQHCMGFNYSIPPADSEYDQYLGHKKLKKKKKKKDKRHKHHHKDKKRRREEENQESITDPHEEGIYEPNAKKIASGHQILPIRPTSSYEPRPSPAGSSGLSPHREPRTCVLKKYAEKTPLQKLLEHLLKSLEKRDPKQYFAWPVTDNIAPNYSQIIKQPMDFSTMKQKVDDNLYYTLKDFVNDFKLMCDNAMTYNHAETIYYKAAKKLLHVGLKMVTPEKLKQMRPALPYMQDLTSEELGFELIYEELDGTSNLPGDMMQIIKDQEHIENVETIDDFCKEIQRKTKLPHLEKFEAVPDDLTPEEILKQAQGAAKNAADKLTLKRVPSKMGFLRQQTDGTTSLQILVPGDGVIPGTNQRPVSLGQLVGKLTHGSGSLAGFRDDRRNMSKTVKPLYYGAFGSYAPSYDSTFANLTKEESDLVYQTYGDETGVQYAESILDFAKDSDYTLTMVDDMLDILTHGEHKKTKSIIEEKKRLKEEEEKIKKLLEKPAPDINKNISTVEKVKVDVDQLKTLSELGIDVDFLDPIEEELKASEERSMLQNRLDDTSNMINNLRQVQHCRLSAPPPQHLSNVPKASDSEVTLAGKITESLTDIAKKLPPSAIAPVEGLRRAMGIAPMGGPEPMDVEPITHNPAIVTENNVIQENPTTQEANTIMSMSLEMGNVRQEQLPIQMNLGPNQSQLLNSTEVTGVNDLESELREFLESDPTLGHSPLHDDKTLEDILSES